MKNRMHLDLNNKNFYFLCIAVAINSIASTTTWIFLPIYFKTQGATTTDVGLMLSICTLVGAILSLPMGKASDIIGRKPLIIFSLTGYSLSWFLIFLFRTVEWFYISMVVRGPFLSLQGAVTSFIADVYPVETRGKAMGTYQGIVGIGRVIGPAAMGVVIEFFSFEGYFLLASCISVASLVGVIFLVKESKTVSKPTVELFKLSIPRLNRPRFSLEKRNKSLVLYYVGHLGDIGRQMLEPLLGVYLLERGLIVSEIGLINTVAMFALVIGGPIFGGLCDKFGRKWMLIGGKTLLGLTLLLYTQVGSFGSAMAVRLLDRLAFSLSNVSGNALVADLLPVRLRGTGLGLLQSLVSLDTAGAAAIGGYVANSYGWETLFIIGPAVLFSGAGILCSVTEPRKLQ